jgi:hypothetical protein
LFEEEQVNLEEEHKQLKDIRDYVGSLIRDYNERASMANARKRAILENTNMCSPNCPWRGQEHDHRISFTPYPYI